MHAELRTVVRSLLQETRHPICDRVATAHIGLDQPVDHERRRHVDTVLAGVLAVPLHLSIEIGDCEGLSKVHTAVALDPPDDVVGGGIKVRPAAMVVEFEFFTMRSDSRYNRRCRGLPAFERRSREDAADNHARVHVPRLGLKTQLDGNAVLARLGEKVVEFAERLDGKWACRFEEHLEDARPATPYEWVSSPCTAHTIFPSLPFGRRGDSRRSILSARARRSSPHGWTDDSQP